MIRLTPQPLTAAAFAPFGEVIDEQAASGFAINGGTSLRLNDLARLDPGEDGRVLFNLFVCRQSISLPHQPAVMECHPLGSQAFLPRHFARFLVLVAPPAPQPDLSQLRCFLSDGRQGVNYARGVWHLPLSSLEPETFVVVDRGGSGNNCHEVSVAGQIEVLEHCAKSGSRFSQQHCGTTKG